jgi:hypothetical protein
MGDSSTVLVAIIGAIATVLAAWITSRGNRNDQLSGGASAVQNVTLSRGIVASLITAGVFYALGVLYFLLSIYALVELKASNPDLYIYCNLSLAIPLLFAANVFHRRAQWKMDYERRNPQR